MARNRTTAKKSAIRKSRTVTSDGRHNVLASRRFRVEGKMSTFGGPHDFGMTPSEGLALFEKSDLTIPRHAVLFLSAPPPGTSGLGRRLNPDKFYIACRWNYAETPRSFLRETTALVENPQNGRSFFARPVDWGPNASTSRVADLSPGLAGALGLDTDDECIVTIAGGTTFDANAMEFASEMSDDEHGGHGSSNAHAKPPIKEFIQSPNRSSRNGARIEMIVLHCTEGTWQGTKNTFLNPGGRQVSAHYIIDRNGDIYQMVADNERANHARGANSSSIGIEHVGTETQVLSEVQTQSSAQLIRWLLTQYDIPRTNIYGHDFAPGYSGSTSCPDRLFGGTHSQQTIVDWVARNV